MEGFAAIVAEAMLAPSAHNTQPVRWADAGGSMVLSVDPERRLPAGDADDRDLKVACGAAAEGSVLALAARGMGAEVTWLPPSAPGDAFARITPRGLPAQDDVALAPWVTERVTHRGGFDQTAADLAHWRHDHLTLVTDRGDIGWLAQEIDRASAKLMETPDLRRELLDWMRLSPRDLNFTRDGLNRDSLFLGRVAAACVGPVLGTRVYDVLARLGLGPTLSGERGRSAGACAIALFHWPETGSLYEAGRAFYRLWLEATARGLAGWPAAALADAPQTNAAIAARFGLPQGHIFLNSLRLGPAKGATPTRARLPVSEVIIAP